MTLAKHKSKPKQTFPDLSNMTVQEKTQLLIDLIKERGSSASVGVGQ